MKFSQFKRICAGILDRIGAEKFKSAGFRLHDVAESSQWAQATVAAGGIAERGGAVDIFGGHSGLTVAQVFDRVRTAAEKLGGDPEVTVFEDPVFVFGYDSQQGNAVASYDIPRDEDVDESVLRESILDAPKDRLDPSVWDMSGGEPRLTPRAAATIAAVAEWAKANGIGPDADVRVIGSIASNSYSEESDVDVHFSGDVDFKGMDPYVFNRGFKKAFKEYAERNPAVAQIGGHEVEVYAQPNPFQDLMSVGCYDVAAGKWLSGPEIKDVSFDPYSEYYEDDMKRLGGLIDEIRRTTAELHEMSFVIMRSSDSEFVRKTGEKFLGRVADMADLLEKLRQMRRLPPPDSLADAARKRSSREWHIADSAFKLMDKFGYIGVGLACRDAVEQGMGAVEAAETVSEAFAEHMGKTAGDERVLGEGIGSALRTAALAGITAASAAFGGTVQDRKVQADGVRPAAVQTAAKEKSYAGLRRSSLVNLLATIAYNEAMTDWIKTRDDDSVIAILNVIGNRAGGKAENFASVISRKGQFYSARHVKGGYVDRNYVMYDPQTEARSAGGQLSPRQKDCWRICREYASDLVDGDLPNVIGNRNMIANKGADNKKSYNAWGRDCDLVIGSHSFGYDPAYDPGAKKAGKAKKPAENIYVVQPGDTLIKIAKKNKTTAGALARKNGLSDPNKLKIGQELKL